MRIDISECIDMISYAIGKDAGDTLRRHWTKYKDWNRIKDIATKQIIANTAELARLRSEVKKLRKANNNLNQLNIATTAASASTITTTRT